MKLNIYQFKFGKEKDWIIAPSKEEAIRFFICETGADKEKTEKAVSFLKKKDWDKYTYWEDDPDNSITFAEYMKNHKPEAGWFCSNQI
jgi:hypothetical protein